MERLRSIDALRALADRLLDDPDADRPTIVIPAGTCGQASGANDLIRVAKREILSGDLADRVRLRITGCHGFCQMEPSVLVEPRRTYYPKVDVEDMARIVAAAARGETLPECFYRDPASGEAIERQDDVPFFRHQERLILARNERVDPIRIFNYIEDWGYSALAAVLERDDPRWVVGEVTASGLRGRGGAGFPTGRKWELLASEPGREKVLICNADEGDPGAYMDRAVLEGNPHSIIEGMIIGAVATGATEGVVYVRSEYPLAIKHLVIALHQARELGLLGEDILGSGLSFDISVVRGAGAFVCGEETALIASVEGKVGEPRQRPPFPVQLGVDGKPTAINNVETWANVPLVFLRGAGRAAGTKIFSLVGKVRNTGLIEVPMGIPIGRIIDQIGGGPSGKAPIKAVQTGGPSGGCIPAERFDLHVDYDSLREAGSIMGSGGMIVLDERTCAVDVARYFTAFLEEESCGKCFTCRKGIQRMHEILEDVCRGTGTPRDLDLLAELATVIGESTMCGLGQTAPNPVLSTLRYFRDEYVEHIERRRCRAGVCKDLIRYSINERCTGCLVCIRYCPEDAITGRKKEVHVLDGTRCTRCGSCASVCKFDAVDVV